MPKGTQISSTAFDTAYAKLNPEQRAAVDAIEGPVMVIAGPGTGKTEVLTLRIANIRRLTDTPPEAILALTFTESGAAAMRKRLARLMGPDAYHVRITTFHGFCNDIIKNYPEDFPKIIGSTNITDVEQLDIVQHLMDAVPLEKLRPANRPYMFVKAVIHAIGDLKQENVRPDDFLNILREEHATFDAIPDLVHEKGPHKGKMKSKYEDELRRIEKNVELARLYAAYEAALHSRHGYDYNDMILEVARALDLSTSLVQHGSPRVEASNPLLQTLQENHLYILVDEHQDTNKAQNHIVERIASAWDDPNVFLVGDEHQAIYRFQGASRENFHYFKTRWPHLKLIRLRENYRSTQRILDAAHALSPNALAAKAGHPEIPIEVWGLSAPEVEQYFIATTLANIIAEGMKPDVSAETLVKAEEIAVLYRDNRDAFPIARMLERVGVPYTIESDQDVLADEDIKKLVAIMKAVQHYGDPSYLVPVLHIDFLDIAPLDVYKLLAAANRRNADGKRTNLYDIIRSKERLASALLEEPEKLLSLANRLSDWKRAARNRPVTDAFEEIVRDSGFLAHVLGQNAVHEKLAKLHSLFDQAKSILESKKDSTLERLFDYLDLIETHDANVKPLRLRSSPGRVRLMTAHRSKGQEFDVVLIAGATDGKWGPRAHIDKLKLPHRVYQLLEQVETDLSSEASAKEDEDERNLFYVALTRGRKRVIVSYAERAADGREEVPCRFLKQIEGVVANAEEQKLRRVEEAFAEKRDIEFAPKVEKGGDTKDKEFLNALFREQPFSVTALNNYLECPWKYFYTSLLRIPEAPQLPLVYGSAIHNAIKNFFDVRSRGDAPSAEFLTRRFGEELRRQPLAEHDFGAQLARGTKALEGWHGAWHATWLPNGFSEYEISGIELTPEITLTGKLDRMELLDNGNTVNVVDYKTGRPKSRNAIMGLTASGDENYIRQLTFYNLLLDKQQKYHMTAGDIDFVEPDERGNYRKESFTVPPETVTALEEQIKTVGQEILDLTFWDKTCDDPECKYCSLRAMMK